MTYDNFEQEVLSDRGNGRKISQDGPVPLPDEEVRRGSSVSPGLFLQELDEPTMIVMFGDHQPSVEDEFYDEISRHAQQPGSHAQERLMWYETPFITWTNYEHALPGFGAAGSRVSVLLCAQAGKSRDAPLRPVSVQSAPRMCR